MRFFITGGYAALNPGDIAILKSTVWRLHSLFPGSHFVIWCDKDFSPPLGPGVSSELFIHRCPSFFMGIGRAHSALMRLYLLTYPLSQAVLRLLRAKEDGAAAHKMKGCDAVLFIGGGYLNSLYPFDLMQMHHHSCLARESGRPVYLLGQTIGPFRNRWYKRIAGSIFGCARRIVTREKYSGQELREFSGKVLDGADDALDFANVAERAPAGTPLRYFERTNGSQVLLGLNLRSVQEGPAVDYPELVKILNRFNEESAQGLLKVIFIPMQTSRHSNDLEEAARFGELPGRSFAYEVIAEPLAVEDKLRAISKTDLFLGMRFHSLVFAVSSAVPCLGLFAGGYYFKKNRGLLEIYGMERYCLSVEHLSELPEALADLYRNRDRLRSRLKEKHAAVLERQKELYRTLFS